MDAKGTKAARNYISMIKVAAPRVALKVIDDAIQIHGAHGVRYVLVGGCKMCPYVVPVADVSDVSALQSNNVNEGSSLPTL